MAKPQVELYVPSVYVLFIVDEELQGYRFGTLCWCYCTKMTLT